MRINGIECHTEEEIRTALRIKLKEIMDNAKHEAEQDAADTLEKARALLSSHVITH